MVVINTNCLYPDQQHPFSVKHLPDGTPCIVGSAEPKASTTGESVFVFRKTGGLAKTHPYLEVSKVLYEINTGDFVLVYSFDPETECLLVNSFYISVIGPFLATGIPAIL